MWEVELGLAYSSEADLTKWSVWMSSFLDFPCCSSDKGRGRKKGVGNLPRRLRNCSMLPQGTHGPRSTHQQLVLGTKKSYQEAKQLYMYTHEYIIIQTHTYPFKLIHTHTYPYILIYIRRWRIRAILLTLHSEWTQAWNSLRRYIYKYTYMCVYIYIYIYILIYMH